MCTTWENFDSIVLVERARRMLRDLADPERAHAGKAYLKSPFEFLGVTKADINAVGRRLNKEVKSGGRNSVLQVIGTLWGSGIHEEMSLAVVLASLCIDDMGPADLTGLFSHWLDQCETWDHADELCIRVIGVLALRHPSMWPTIERWADASGKWKRRALLVSNLPAVRARKVDSEQLERSCHRLAPDRDFFIRKAIGWVLRELSEVDCPQLVRTFERIGWELSALSQREATRKLPTAERDALLLSAGQKRGRSTSRRACQSKSPANHMTTL